MYPLQRMQAENIYGPGWVLLGNAANTLHPLAAQGFNLGLRDAVCLAEVLVNAMDEKHKEEDSEENRSHLPYSCFIEELQQYAKLRSQDHYYTHLLTHTLAKEPSLLQFGILASEFLPRVQTLITQQGLGTINKLQVL